MKSEIREMQIKKNKELIIVLNSSKEFMGFLILKKDVGLVGRNDISLEKHPIKEPPYDSSVPRPPIKEPPEPPEPPKEPPIKLL